MWEFHLSPKSSNSSHSSWVFGNFRNGCFNALNMVSDVSARALLIVTLLMQYPMFSDCCDSPEVKYCNVTICLCSEEIGFLHWVVSFEIKEATKDSERSNLSGNM